MSSSSKSLVLLLLSTAVNPLYNIAYQRAADPDSKAYPNMCVCGCDSILTNLTISGE